MVQVSGNRNSPGQRESGTIGLTKEQVKMGACHIHTQETSVACSLLRPADLYEVLGALDKAEKSKASVLADMRLSHL